jgi:hypothetical protein
VGTGTKVWITREEYWHGLNKETPEPEPDVPDYAVHFLAWFFRLSMARRSGFSGAEAISDLDIWAWQQNSGVQLDPEEVEILMAMDNSWRSAISDEQKAKEQREKGKKRGNR